MASPSQLPSCGGGNSGGVLQAFLERGELALLESQPLVLPAAPGFWKYLCCDAWLRGIGSWGGFCAKQPIATFCPCLLVRHYKLEVSACRWIGGGLCVCVRVCVCWG